MRKKMNYKIALLASTVALGIGCADNDTDTPTVTSSDYESTDTSTYASSSSGSEISTTNETAVGAAGGSQQASQSSQPIKGSQSSLQQYIDYKVVDQQEKQIGTVEAFWENNSGEPAYIAIATSGDSEKVRVVPAESAEVNKQQRTIRVAHSADKVQSAPQFEKDTDLNQQQEQQIRRHFGMASAQGSAQRSQQGTQTDNEASIALKEEQLKVGTRETEAGGVVLRKVVRTETVNQPVELEREELVIERVPGQGREVENAQFEEGQIYIPLRREEAVVEKDAVVKEVVNVEKEKETDQRQISEQLRAEELQVIEQDAQTRQGAPGTTETGRSSQQQPRENE